MLNRIRLPDPCCFLVFSYRLSTMNHRLLSNLESAISNRVSVCLSTLNHEPSTALDHQLSTASGLLSPESGIPESGIALDPPPALATKSLMFLSSPADRRCEGVSGDQRGGAACGTATHGCACSVVAPASHRHQRRSADLEVGTGRTSVRPAWRPAARSRAPIPSTASPAGSPISGPR